MNPWLSIPLADYEAHMGLAHVQQARLLSEVLGEALERTAPLSLALLGCAGGNGLEQAAAHGIARVVAVDINPLFIEQVRARWGGTFKSGLELFVGDVQQEDLGFAPVDLVYAGLLFEYLDMALAVPRMRSMLQPEGTLVAVLQLPCAETPEITPSPYTSLTSLSSIMRLVPPDQLRSHAEAQGFHQIDAREVLSAGGKCFSVQTFRASPHGLGRR